MEDADFSGWATKTGLKCSDGRTIMPDAFAHQDGVQVPLVWQHGHNEPANVLGHAILENRGKEGVYTHAYFNATPSGQNAKILVQHKDITALSIYANKLVEKGQAVMHGMIREVSLVLSGANPGALIENVAISHGDGTVTDLDDAAVIYTGLTLEHADPEEDVVIEHAEDDTAQDVYDSLNEQQRNLVHFMIGAALEGVEAPVKHSDEDDKSSVKSEDTGSDDANTDGDKPEEGTSEGDKPEDGTTDTNSGDLAHQEGTNMTNVFEANGIDAEDTKHRLTHDQLVNIVDTAKKNNGHFKDAVLAHAAEYGITDINLLFPDAKALTTNPEFISRRMEWVASVLGGTKHSPFAKVKTLFADITGPEARAKGYVKGTRKEEEVFGLLQRTTGPSTIYKKQKLDRDDILDITDMDVVAWLKAEMRLMIEEEVARAILVGDGRSNLSPDKIKDPAGAIDGTGIRSILHDDDLYSIKKELPANVSAKDSVKAIIRATDEYRGSGSPVMYISRKELTELLLDEDKFGRPLYADRAALADKLGVSRIVTVDLFTEYEGLYAIVVSLSDYTIGSNRGGELTSFEDFDIDFNQHKYLQETRLSGGLTKPFSAIVISKAQGTEATVTQPSFNPTTDTITIPTSAGVVYLINDQPVTGNVVITEPTEVTSEPDDGYYFPTGVTRAWNYTP